MAEGQSSRGTTSEEISLGEDKIRICFNSQDGNRDFYRCYKHAKIQSIVRAYCRARQVDYETLVFLFEGKPFPFVGTVTQAGLNDQDEIDVMITQTGGGGALTQ